MRLYPFQRALFVLLGAGLAVSSAAQSTRPGLGSVPYADAAGTGVTFRTWAPTATSVGVKGSFNGWATTPLFSEGASGLWSRDLAAARPGHQFKFVINNALDRRDPRSRQVVNSAGNTIIYDPTLFDWGGDSFTPPWLNDLVIYEMHVGTFNAEDWIPSTFDEAIEKLDHLENLGINAIEVMPPFEFPGDRSWGYNPADPFAIESALGGPDAFKRFVKACHQRDIAVLVDVVHNHYGPSDLALWQFDGWSLNGLGGIYFYNQLDKASTPWGNTRPNFGQAEVREYIRDHIFMLLDECRVDGFRWDSVFNIIYYNSGFNHLPEGESLLSEINWQMSTQYPGRIRIAEDHAFDFGMNFDSQWDVGFQRHLLWQVSQSSDAGRNMDWLGDHIDSGAGLSRVIFSESHDEVGDLNSKVRLPRSIDSGNPTSIFARKRQLLAASIVLTSPGIPMLFQGQEMNEDWTFSSSTSLRWDLTNTFSGIVRAYSELVHLRRNAFGGTQGLKGAGVVAHQRDDLNKVISFIRWDAGGQVDDVVVVANFSANTWTSNNYQVEFPSTGTWHAHFNGDAQEYGADFGGVVNDSVVAAGNPPVASINLGRYSAVIFSKTPPLYAGLAALDPPEPSGCVEVTIQYTPTNGPLQAATNVVAVIGKGGWQFIETLPLTNSAGVWQASYQIPEETDLLDLAFNDGETNNPVWDSNRGKDWHFPVQDCANLPSLVTTAPTHPQGCVPVSITYTERSGVLDGATNLNLYLGRNDWNHIGTHAMTEGPDGVWTYVYSIPSDTWQLDFVFNGGVTNSVIWDNHAGQDWHVYVTDCVDPLTASIVVTNPADDLTVSNEVGALSLHGRATGNLGSDLSWTNVGVGTGGILSASASWTLAGAPLAEGVNLFHFEATTGTNNPNDGAQDAASNAIYTAGPSWQDGQNGGEKWGGGWQLGGGANAGHYLAQQPGDSNLNSSAHAWGLWAHSGGLAEAVRPLAGRLNAADILRLKFENNWVDGGSVGIGLQNRFGQNLFEFLFIAGDTNYLINDAETAKPTAITWTEDGLDLEFELVTPTTYRFLAAGVEFTGTLAAASELVIDRLRVWNYDAGGGYQRNLYLTDLRIDGLPLQPENLSDEVTITRQYGPFSDADKDGYLTWEEEFAGTDPFSAASRFPPIEIFDGAEVSQIEIEETYPAKWYDVYCTTNLPSGDWIRLGLEQQGSGGPLLLTITNAQPEAYYRTGVFQP